jgi:phospholipase A1
VLDFDASADEHAHFNVAFPKSWNEGTVTFQVWWTTTAPHTPTRTEDGGDGTVPLWSALPVSAQKQLVVGEHASFFSETAFNAVFFRLFGKNFPKPPVAATGVVSAALSVQSLTIHKGDEIELVVEPSDPVSTMNAEVVLERSDGPGKPFKAFRETPISYAGPPIPVLKARLPATDIPGFYRARLAGDPSSPKPVLFAVTEK